jgi:hypothetical protein
LSDRETHQSIAPAELMGIAEFIIGPAAGRTRWLNPSCVLDSAFGGKAEVGLLGRRGQLLPISDIGQSDIGLFFC